MFLSEHKKQIRLKQKDWSKTGVPATSTMYSDQLSRQFLITAHTFSYSSKKSLSRTYSHFTNMPHPYNHTHSHRQTHTLTLTRTHTLTHIETCIKAWICSAEEFLELYGKVEAVIRNCLLRWSGHLVEVAGTLPFFDQSFCFKQISLFLCSDRSIFPLVPSFSLLHLRFFMLKGGNIEPLYQGNETRFWKK